MIIGYAWTSDRTLKPCPFCGGKAQFFVTTVYEVGMTDQGLWTGFVACTKCGILSPMIDGIKDEVCDRLAELWNRRASE